MKKLFFLSLLFVFLGRVNAADGSRCYRDTVPAISDEVYLLKNLDSIGLVAEMSLRKPDKTMAQKQELRKLLATTDSLRYLVLRISDKWETGGFTMEAAAGTYATANKKWNTDIQSLKDNSIGSTTSALGTLGREISAFETGVNMEWDRVHPVEVKVIVRDSAGTELPGFAVSCESLYTPDTDVFNPTKNAVKKIKPGTKIFTVKKAGITRTRQCTVSAVDPNTWQIIFDL